MSENYSNNQNPSGIWQHTWSALFIQFNEQMSANNYIGAWKTIALLKVQIPPECEDDIKADYAKLEKIIKKPVNAYTTIQANRDKKAQLNNEAPDALLTMLAAIRRTLYERHWINKDFNIKPLNRQSPHISS